MERVCYILGSVYFGCLFMWLFGSMLYEHCVMSGKRKTLEEEHNK